ncbi:hypothetical protein SAMN06272765_8576 [Streptomyces sp. Ag109_G2-15]|nr:hypothetical protein SAMN06272765_8576 [Streptomyces sp. Ag109_G2-15]
MVSAERAIWRVVRYGRLTTPDLITTAVAEGQEPQGGLPWPNGFGTYDKTEKGDFPRALVPVPLACTMAYSISYLSVVSMGGRERPVKV